MAEGLGCRLEAEVFVDSSAELGVVGRKGSGKLRHIRVGQLWVQQAAEDEVLAYKKIDGKRNPADCCTKNVNQTILDAALDWIELEIREGRAQESLEANRMEEMSVAAGPRQALNPDNGTNVKVKLSWADELDH